MTDIGALVPKCTLEPAPTESSAGLNGTQDLAELRKHGLEGEVVRKQNPDPPS